MSSWLQRERFVFALTILIGFFTLIVIFLLRYPFGNCVDCSMLATLLLPVFFLSLAPAGFYLEHLLRYGTLRNVRPRPEVTKTQFSILATLVLAGGAGVAGVALVKFSPDCRFSILVVLGLACFSTIVHRYAKILFPKS